MGSKFVGSRNRDPTSDPGIFCYFRSWNTVNISANYGADKAASARLSARLYFIGIGGQRFHSVLLLDAGARGVARPPRGAK